MNIQGKNIPCNKEELATILFAQAYAENNTGETIEAYTQRAVCAVARKYRYLRMLPDAHGNVVQVTPDAADILSCIKYEEPKRKRDFSELAQKMMDLFPIGKKPGTSYLWRGNLQMISQRLAQLYEKSGADFTDDEALAATEAYVKDHAKDQSYMRILKYFIFKNQAGGYGNEIDSDLLSWIENIRSGGTEPQQNTLTEDELFY